MPSYRRKQRWLWIGVPLGVFVVFLVSAFSFYQAERAKWLSVAPTRALLAELQEAPGDGNLTYVVARQLWERDSKPGQALPYARKASKMQPARAEAQLLRGYVALANRLPAEALYYFEKACSLRPDLHHAHAGAGAVYLDAGLTDQALEHLRLAWNPARPEVPVRMNTIEALYQKGDYDEAERLAFDTMNYSPPGAVLPYQQLYRINKKRGRGVKIRDLMREKVRRSITLTAPFYSELAFIVMEEDQGPTATREAEGLARRALKVGWDDPTAMSAMAAVLVRQRQFDAALKQLRTALSLDARNERARMVMARCLRAMNRSTEAVRFEPPRQEPLRQEAIAHLKQQAAKAGSDLESRMRLAEALQHGGDYLGSFQVCWEVIRTDPENQPLMDLANQALSRLVEVRNRTRTLAVQ